MVYPLGSFRIHEKAALTENVSSTDEGISSEIQSALHQLVLNQAVTALKNGVDEMLDVLYEDTKGQE